jgi:uncharacterized protein (TIGR02284 family)
MAHDNTIDHLDRLINVNKDAEASLSTAAGNVTNSELETLFGGFAKQHAKFAIELEEEVERLGGRVASPGPGTLGGALHRGWIDLKSALTGRSAAAILSSCESGEQSAEIAYADAADANPSGRTHTLVEKQRQQIKEFHARLTRLVEETKRGVDFQSNQ